MFIGMAIGPALTGVYLESRESIDGIPGTYPTLGSYNLVDLTSGLSAVSLIFVLMLKKRATNKKIEV